MLKSFRLMLARWIAPAQHEQVDPAAQLESSRLANAHGLVEIKTDEVLTPHPVIYDENLYERARTQWQFGDWQNLSMVGREELQHQPERAKLALMVAASHLQTNNAATARSFIRLAQEWGCSKKLIGQIMVAGVYNSLGRAAAVAGQQPRALRHFENAISNGAQGADQRLLTQARINEQTAQLGLDLQGKFRRDLQLSLPRHSLASTMISAMVQQCLENADVHKAVDSVMHTNKLSPREKFLFYIELAQRFFERKDNLTTVDFLGKAGQFIDDVEAGLKTMLVQKYISAGKPDMASDIAIKQALMNESKLSLSPREKAALQSTYDKGRKTAQAKSEHGHDLLLAWLNLHLADMRASQNAEKPVLIEIGSTRESVPGQGSTRKLAAFCKQHDLHFITVDMDPHNTRMAAEEFSKLGTTFEAVTGKGEDYLREYTGNIDCIFLDAYDFDHGKHSELRQSRYEKFLGQAIDDEECHQMHLDCAHSIVAKLSANGVVCFDDTWLEEGAWTAKGTLAMPYLLENGFRVLEARNRAALLARSPEMVRAQN